MPAEMDAHGDDEEEKDLLNRLDSRKLEAIYNDYNLFAGDKGLKIQQFLAVMVQEQHLGIKKDYAANIKMIR